MAEDTDKQETEAQEDASKTSSQDQPVAPKDGGTAMEDSAKELEVPEVPKKKVNKTAEDTDKQETEAEEDASKTSSQDQPVAPKDGGTAMEDSAKELEVPEVPKKKVNKMTLPEIESAIKKTEIKMGNLRSKYACNLLARKEILVKAS